MNLVRIEEQGGVLVVTLDRPRANAFDEELVADLRQAFREAAGSAAVVLASALPSIFSAGWDLKTLLGFDRKTMEGFLEAYCDLVREIFELFRHLLGARGMERLASTGENLSVEKALALGLVDRMVLPQDLLPRSLERAAFLAKLPGSAHASIKRRARAAAFARFDQARERDPFLDEWFKADALLRIAALVAKLSKKN